MKSVLYVAGILVCCASPAFVQAQTLSILTNDTTVCPGTTLPLNAIGSNAFVAADDTYSGVIPIGFDFVFYGNTYSSCLISSNGYISFNIANAYTGSAYSISQGIPGNTATQNSIMGFYADILQSAGGLIQYVTLGTAPNRQFVVTFCNTAMFSCNNNTCTFQMVLFETSNNIEVHITSANVPTCSWNGSYAIEGVQNSTGTAATVAGNHNYPNVWSATNEGYQFVPVGTTSYTATLIPFATFSPGPGSITWYDENGNFLANGGTITVMPTQTTSYIAQSSGGCDNLSGSFDTVTITVIPLPPAPTVTSLVNYCQGDVPTQLSATADSGNNLLWYTTPAGPSSTIAPTPSTTVPGTTTYYVSQSAGCEGPQSSITVTVAPTPAAPAASSLITYCQNDIPSQLVAAPSGTGTVQWFTTPAGGTGTATAPTPSTSTPGTTTYYVSETNASNCESQRTPINVVVNPTPALPAVTSPVHICQGEPSQQLQATGGGLKYYTAPTGGTGTAVAPVPPTASPATTYYYVSQTLLGCEGPRAEIMVVIDPKPLPPIVTDSVFYCQDLSSEPLIATATDSNFITWYQTSAGGVGTVSPLVPSTLTAGTYYFYATQTTPAGCESVRSRTTVIIKPHVIAEIEFDKAALCNNDTLTVSFTGVAAPFTQYTWDFDGGENRNNATTEGPYYIYYAAPGTKTVTLYLSALGCTDTATKSIVVDTPPEVAFQLPDDACENEVVRIQAGWNAVFADGYAWDFDGAATSYGSGGGVYFATWATPGPKVVTMQVTIGACKSLPVTDTVTIHALPVVNITSTLPATICEGDTLKLTATNAAGYNYVWRPAGFIRADSGATALFIARGPAALAVYVTDSFNCKGADSIDIAPQPCCTVSVPSAFTPNGDGRNDVFRILTPGHHTLGIFRVMNRWGVTVFQTQDELRGWDGTLGGIPQDMGTYFYYISFRCEGKDIEKQGDLTLIR